MKNRTILLRMKFYTRLNIEANSGNTYNTHPNKMIHIKGIQDIVKDDYIG